jgi:hypothetical protein
LWQSNCQESDIAFIARIEFFVNFTWAFGHVILDKGDIDVTPGHYTVVTCLSDSSLKHAPNSKLMLFGEFPVSNRFYLAPVESIFKPVFVVEGIRERSNQVVVVEHRDIWSHCFHDFKVKENKKGEKRMTDLW